jgi:peptidoglycan hydrolase-like protein with peptidoglycan-binding domain
MKKASFKTALAAACVWGAVGLGPAVAADANHDFAVHGIGALTCTQLTNAPAKAQEQVRVVLASWLLGYLTALNRTDAVTYDATPVQDEGALVNMVAGVCKLHPKVPVEAVAFSVFQSLDKAKLATASPEIKVTVGKSSTVLRQDTLSKVEKVLVSLKYLPAGQATGAFSGSTAVALLKFQTAQKLPTTGLPDPATVVRALVELKT